MEPAKKPIRTDELMDTDGPIKSEQPTVFGDAVDEPNSHDSTFARNEVAEALELLAEVRNIKSDSDSQTGRLPEKIGRYRILSSAGRGGFSEVFHAVDEDLQRHVALKIPLMRGKKEFQIRFEREARLAAMLSHRQIVPVYEFGGIGELDFIAYSWVEGETLAQWLASNNGLVDGKMAAKIVAGLARAMHFAHERGVVHRDLKPANVLIDHSDTFSQQPIELRTRITDLGLSRDLSEEDQRLTQTGQALGTPAYMSPEQAVGDSDIGIGTDIYSLGIMLFEMLTGELPFRKSNAIETLTAIAGQPAPSVSKFRSGASRELAAIVDKCLQKKTSQRYLSAFDLAEDLDAFVEDRPVSARTLGLMSRTRRWIARNRVLTATTATVLFSLSIGLGTALWQWSNATKESVRANREAVRAVKESDRASSHLNSMFRAIDLMLADNEVHAQAEVPESQKKLLIKIVSLQRSLADDREAEEFTLSQLEGLSRVIKIHSYLGQYEECEEMFEEGRSLFEQLDFAEFEPDAAGQVWSLIEKTYQHYIFSQRRMNKPDSTIEAIDGFEKMVERVQPFHDPLETIRLRIDLLDQRANVAIRTRDLDAAQDDSDRACSLAGELIEEMGNPLHAKAYALQVANTFANRARVAVLKGLDEKASESSATAIRFLKLYLEQNPENVSAQKNLALQQQMVALYTENPGAKEKELLEQSTRQFKSIVEQFPSDMYSKEALAGSYLASISLMEKMQRSAPDEAMTTEKAFQRLQEIDALVEQGLLTTDDGRGKYLSSLHAKCRLFLDLGRVELARAAAVKAVETVKEFDMQNASVYLMRRWCVKTYQNLARCELALGNPKGVVSATTEIRKLIAEESDRTDSTGDFHKNRADDLAWALSHESRQLAKLGQFEKAVERARQHYATVFTSGIYQGHTRYRSSARLLSGVLAKWSEAGGTNLEGYQQAKSDAYRWLETGMDNGFFPTSTALEKSSMDPLRDDERFDAIVERVRAAEN